MKQGCVWGMRTCVLMGCVFNGIASAEEMTVHLRVEKAGSPAGPWEPLDSETMATTGDGAVVDVIDESGAFYRLQIGTDSEEGSVLGIPLSMVPQEVLQIAIEHLESLRTEEPEWASAELGPVAVPVYSPAVAEGQDPAYYELIVGLSPQPEPPDYPAFPLNAPAAQVTEPGYILVASGRHDVPIPQYATSGISPSMELRLRCKDPNARIVRYDPNFWVAEGVDEQVLATLGTTPYRMPVELLDFIGRHPSTEVLNNDAWQESVKPEVQPAAYGSYKDFKDDYVNGPVYTWLHTAKAKLAALDWAAWDDVAPPYVKIPVMEDTLILQDIQIDQWELEENIAQAWIEEKGGLWVTSSLDASTLLCLIDKSGEVHYFVLVIGEPIDQLGWTSWRTDWASSCADIPRYNQVYDLSGCCNNGYSGCGATAWALFFGFWDKNGSPNLIGGTTTPTYNNSHVEACIQELFPMIHSWCTLIDGQSATNPWDMSEGWRYVPGRGGISMSTNWCVPYTSWSPRIRARDAIRTGRPAIVGTGYFAHYPFAYGYRYRRYRALGITWSTQRQWKVQPGWGGSTCSWFNANSCWFGMNAWCD